MYYDLIASLPRLPHFASADHLPITRLRLMQRLRRVKPAHQAQLERAQRLVGWGPEAVLGSTDAKWLAAMKDLFDSPLVKPLRDYVAFRLEQRTLLAALRRKRAGLELPDGESTGGAGSRLSLIRRNWNLPEFGMGHLYPWLAPAQASLAAGDALGLERLLMEEAWRRLTRFAEQDMFGFAAVFAYVFRWDILQTWLAYDAAGAQIKFAELMEKVTQREQN